jgi:hypothetical protein
MEHGPGRVRMGTRRGTLSFIELPVDTGRRGYMICVPINIGCCTEPSEHGGHFSEINTARSHKGEQA